MFLEEEKIDYFSGNREKTLLLIDLAAKNLPEDEFMILMLCVCERYQRREVAIMKLSVSGVTWKLNRALDKLRKLAKGGGIVKRSELKRELRAESRILYPKSIFLSCKKAEKKKGIKALSPLSLGALLLIIFLSPHPQVVTL